MNHKRRVYVTLCNVRCKYERLWEWESPRPGDMKEILMDDKCSDDIRTLTVYVDWLLSGFRRSRSQDISYKVWFIFTFLLLVDV